MTRSTTPLNSSVERHRTRIRPVALCVLLLLLGTLGLLGMAAQAPEPSLVISEIFLDPPGANTTQAIELFNAGPTSVSLDGAVLAVGDQTRPLGGLAQVPPGGVVVIRWNQTGASGGSLFFTGRTFELNPAQGSVALFKSSQVTSPSEMLAYVQWGAARQARAPLAEQAGLWDPAVFLPRAAEGQSLALFPGGSGRSLGDWAATAPSVGAVNPAAAAGFRGWRLVGARSSQPPAIAFLPEAGSLELASVALGGTVEHRRYVGDAWSLIGTPGSALSPALASGPDGALELIGVGADSQLLHNRHVFDQWDGFTPVGTGSALPAALAFNPAESTTELVMVGPDNQLQHSRFDGFQWSAFQPVGAVSGAAPALVFNPEASTLELLFSGADRAVYHARFMEGAWSTSVNTGGPTLLRPALTLLPDGSLEAAITGADGSVRQNRFGNGRWNTWQPIPGLRSDLPPALVYNARRQATELFAVGFDRHLRQARRTSGGWSLPVATGAITAHPPAAVIGASGMVELLVTGQDGHLWHNRFQAPLDGPVVTLSRDVQPIFTSSCALSGCHRGSSPAEGLNLAAGQAHGNTVGVPSSQAPHLSLVEPGDPDKSYLLHKLNGTQRGVGGEGTRMPRNRAPLTAAQINRVRQWIEQGAENN